MKKTNLAVCITAGILCVGLIMPVSAAGTAAPKESASVSAAADKAAYLEKLANEYIAIMAKATGNGYIQDLPGGKEFYAKQNALSKADQKKLWELVNAKYGAMAAVSPPASYKTETAGKPAGSSSPSQVKKLTGDELKAYADKVFELVNAERKKAGLGTVEWSNDLAVCAQIRAQEISVKQGHERPNPVNDGINWPKNTNGKGVYNAPSVADEQGIEHSWIMENTAYKNKTAKSAMEAWMGSSGHSKNILRESHVRCGIGVYQAENGGIYWALWFDSYEK
ncbi:hypothetical protein FACS1894191_4520 [Clostridia bacterium]|nr:hypothetical protein FACS1894191_4520 [Clostridia bacterium]